MSPSSSSSSSINWRFGSRASSVASESYYPSDVSTQDNDDEDDDDTWSDTLEEPEARIQELNSPVPPQEAVHGDETPKADFDGEATPVHRAEDERPMSPLEDLIAAAEKLNMTLEISTGDGGEGDNSGPVAVVSSRKRRDSASSSCSSSRPPSRTGGRMRNKARAPPPPPVLQQQQLERDRRSASRDIPETSDPTSPSSSSSLKLWNRRRSYTKSIQAQQHHGLQPETLSSEAAAATSLSTSPSKCPHCTIHSWLPHSSNCPKNPRANQTSGAKSK